MMFGKRPRETTLYILNVNLKYTKGNCQLVLGKESKGNYCLYGCKSERDRRNMSGGLWKKSQRSVSQTFADQKQKKKNDCNANSNKDKRESLITIQDFSAINGNKIFHEKEILFLSFYLSPCY